LKTSCKVRKVSATRPEAGVIASAVKVVTNGGVVVFPTTGLYGLGADALQAGPVNSVFKIKGRPAHKPILLLIKEVADLNRFVVCVPDTALQLIRTFWPGGLTLVFRAKDSLPQGLTGGSGKIGVRLPVHPVARALVERLDGPLTGTSANVSGRPGCSDIALLDAAVSAAANFILDAGPLKGGPGSTVVDVTESKPVILREGVVFRERILAALA